FDNDEINSDKLNSHVESNFVESTSNHDTVKIDNLDEFFGPLIPIHIAEEETIRREHADYINRMEMLFTINPHPHPTVNAYTNNESISSLPIPIQDNDSEREEIDIVSSTDDVLPPGVENDDSEGEVDAVDALRVDNSISNSEHEFFESESDSKEIENFLNDDSIPIGVENSEFNMEEDILFLESLLSEEPCPNPPMTPNQTKSSIKEPEHSFSMGREHADYINRMEMLFTINPHPHPTVNAYTNNESISSLPIPIQDNDSEREEIDIVSSTDDVLPPGVENDDSEGEVDAVDALRVFSLLSAESEDTIFDPGISD
nr:hypothetical protein [Tanacetum cinerariifolium]